MARLCDFPGSPYSIAEETYSCFHIALETNDVVQLHLIQAKRALQKYFPYINISGQGITLSHTKMTAFR